MRKQKAAREDAWRGYVRLWNSGRQSRVPVFPATGRVYGWLGLRANQRLIDQLDAPKRNRFSEAQRASSQHATS
ncbi:hypothetical protein [Ralstonia chuxiongensis]|uniref:hypothetical protein n=1 Tax=Ralstonia chuxiongensis TaxID=2957504 RepID=UPI0029305262|nr:hypothetical protein [Ralstonia chuxiongensis]